MVYVYWLKVVLETVEITIDAVAKYSIRFIAIVIVKTVADAIKNNAIE